jgi:hypothetical protein
MGGWLLYAAPRRLHPWDRQSVSTVQEAGWAPRTVWMVRKTSPQLGFDPRTVQPLASHYTNYVMSVHQIMHVTTKCTFRVSFLQRICCRMPTVLRNCASWPSRAIGENCGRVSRSGSNLLARILKITRIYTRINFFL